MQESKKYLNELQVSKITGRAVQTLRNDRSKHQGLPFIRLGRQIRYDYDAVISAMEARQITPGIA